MRQITRISPCALTGEYAQNNPQYGYKEEIIVGADALRFRNGEKNNSCVMGVGTTANTEGQVVVGKYNKESNALFIIGNGTKGAKGNIAEFYDNKAIISGELEITKNVIIEQDIEVKGNSVLKGTLTIDGALTVENIKTNSDISYVTTADVKAVNNLDNYYTIATIDSKLNNYLTTATWKSKVTGSSNWNWNGQPGQPTWLWGGNEIGNFYVYNPANFSVAYATNANYATSAGSATTATGLNIPNLGSVKSSTDIYGKVSLELYSAGSIQLNPAGGANSDNFIFMHNTYGNNYDGGRTLRVDSDGEVHTGGSSSKRFKKCIEEVTAECLNPHLLYQIPIKQYYYKNEKLQGLRIGFIAEDVAEIYPVAAIYDKVGPENWDERYIIPPMLKLIQEQHEAIEILKEEIQKLKGNS